MPQQKQAVQKKQSKLRFETAFVQCDKKRKIG